MQDLTLGEGRRQSPVPSEKIDSVRGTGWLRIFGAFGLSTKEPYTFMLRHLCTPLPGTGLDIETSYLVYICTYVPKYTHQIFSDSGLWFLNSHFGIFL